ncbi:protein-L-isoaspartate O-methyltransferase family protein [Streptomyces deccanensis]|uniref:protein-L-isoaspartate O-methyltransferase family protein n=1 Tax=Streptomyces deccanensis TaxID=424188 RepID=UPI001EFC08EB|nr:protein-L-isoaspartate(D-aspartate) O-methyltransferase [Streptomyces deccanensis]ULR48396.1 protein-L-isoaspartate(D-aspartate) O-methyltransferase [Streptomyces deccanensis]
MEWLPHAQRLAREVVRPESRWHSAVATVPRHTYVPRWWEADGDAWILRDGQSNPDAWLKNVYTDTTLVTRVDTCHADVAGIEGIGIISDGTPTSSSTLPSLVVRMYRHAMIADDNQILVTTGTGYGTALACARLGSDHVTSVDVDEWLVNIAQDRLSLMGERPRVEVCDITGPLPGEYDRIVATVSVRRVPVSWLQALRRGGRFVTTLAGTGLILTADKTEDGGAVGRIEWDRAGFMPTRHGADYEHPADDVWKGAMEGEGEATSTSRYPLLYPPDAWDVMSMLALNLPGIDYRHTQDGETRTVWLLHPDGSWARATASGFLDSPTVHQSGPRRLWDELERIRHRLNREGALPVYGAQARVDPDGTLTLSRGAWSMTVN